jgi:hypothetical protein
MGFKPGESLGRVEDPSLRTQAKTEEFSVGKSLEVSDPAVSAKKSGHLVEPLPLDAWSGVCVPCAVPVRIL